MPDICDHASAIINGVSTSPALVTIGGWSTSSQVNECLLLGNITTGQYRCKKVCHRMCIIIIQV